MSVIEGVVAVPNPVSSGAKLEAEPPVNGSDADVPSVLPREQKLIGALLSKATGGPSVLYRVLQTVPLTKALVTLGTEANERALKANMEAPNDLLRVSVALNGFSVVLLLLALGSARSALMPGGALERLNVGVQKVRAAESKKLRHWRVGLGVLSVAFMLITITDFFGWRLEMSSFNRRTLTGHAAKLLQVVLVGIIMPIIFSGWWASMTTASCLCKGNIVGVIMKVDSTDPADGAAWDEDVVKPALALVESMETLSRGWSSGLLGLGAFLGLNGLGWFINVMNPEWTDGQDSSNGWAPGTTRTICLSWTVFCVFLPLLLATNIATTSSRCD
eukprot:SAG31_NODE_9920_length_1210_cov_1.189919_1_plen_331_part_10